jgi:hypothetical protein
MKISVSLKNLQIGHELLSKFVAISNISSLWQVFQEVVQYCPANFNGGFCY